MLVRNYRQRFASPECYVAGMERSEFARLNRLQDRVLDEVAWFSAAEHRLSREAVHDRERLRQEYEASRAEQDQDDGPDRSR